jgi:hypothetical protein
VSLVRATAVGIVPLALIHDGRGVSIAFKEVERDGASRRSAGACLAKSTLTGPGAGRWKGPFADGFGGVFARAGVWAIWWGTAPGGLAMRETSLKC